MNNQPTVYEVQEGEATHTLTITNPKSVKPTLREIIYYHIIEKPYEQVITQSNTNNNYNHIINNNLNKNADVINDDSYKAVDKIDAINSNEVIGNKNENKFTDISGENTNNNKFIIIVEDELINNNVSIIKNNCIHDKADNITNVDNNIKAESHKVINTTKNADRDIIKSDNVFECDHASDVVDPADVIQEENVDGNENIPVYSYNNVIVKFDRMPEYTAGHTQDIEQTTVFKKNTPNEDENNSKNNPTTGYNSFSKTNQASSNHTTHKANMIEGEILREDDYYIATNHNSKKNITSNELITTTTNVNTIYNNKGSIEQHESFDKTITEKERTIAKTMASKGANLNFQIHSSKIRDYKLTKNNSTRNNSTVLINDHFNKNNNIKMATTNNKNNIHELEPVIYVDEEYDNPYDGKEGVDFKIRQQINGHGFQYFYPYPDDKVNFHIAAIVVYML